MAGADVLAELVGAGLVALVTLLLHHEAILGPLDVLQHNRIDLVRPNHQVPHQDEVAPSKRRRCPRLSTPA